MRAALTKLRAIPTREWPALAAAGVVAVIVEIGLRVTTLPRLAKRLGMRLGIESGAQPVMTPPSENLRLPPRAVRQFNSSLRVIRSWPFGDTCLRRALVSGQRLRRFNPTLQVGVAKIDGELRAHAWLEIDGISLDPGSGAFESLEPIRSRPGDA